MNALSLEQLTPRVIGDGYKRVIMTPPSNTTITPYKGCFVRYRIKSGGSPTLNTIKLVSGETWSYYEAVQNDGNYNNRPFGIISNNPAEADAVKDPSAGKWAVIVFDTEDAPIRVAFRVINDNYHFEPAVKTMLGKRFIIAGKEITTNEGTFVLPFAMQYGSGGLICRQVYPAIQKDEANSGVYADYGWVVLDLNYALGLTDQTEEDKFLSFPYVIPFVPPT